MSLAIGMTGKDGMVLAADSRGTIGDPRGLTAMNDTMQKLFQLNSRSGCAVFGSAEMGLAALSSFRGWGVESGTDFEDLTVEKIADEFSNVACQSYARWFPNIPPPNRPDLGMIIGGLDAQAQPAVYVLFNQFEFTPMPSPSGFHFGGVVNYAIYLAHRFYDREMSVSNLARLAEYLIFETSTQDPKVGGPIDIATIDAVNGYRELEESEVADIRDRNKALSADLCKAFMGA
jgi:20S proteasome alpha/beta subunit